MKSDEKMLFDRIKLKMNLNDLKENIEEIEKNLKEKGTYVYKIDLFKNFYMIKRRFFNIYFYPIKNYIILDFNFQKFFTNVNINGVNCREALQVINSINKFLKNEIGINKDIKEWEMYYVELKKDMKYRNKKEVDMVINNSKKCTKGNMRFGDYQTGYYRFTRNGNKINIYNKEEELKSHENWDKLDEEEKYKVKNVVRFEVSFNQKKSKKILKMDKVLFKNILSIKIQEKIFNDYFLNMGFTVGMIPTKTNLENKIKGIGLGRKQTEKLIKFVEIINKHTFNKVKELFPCTYHYLKILRENNLPVYFLDAEEKDILKEKIEENKSKVPIYELKNNICNQMYNIYTLFYKNFILCRHKLE